MSYCIKTSTFVSTLQCKLKPVKTFEDFQTESFFDGGVKQYDVGFLLALTRVINVVSTEDPNIVYLIGLSCGEIDKILQEAAANSQ